MVVKKSFDPGNEFVPWQSIGFVKSPTSAYDAEEFRFQLGERCLLGPVARAKFKRGDLFSAVSLEYASDVEAHAEWIGVASSKKTVRHAPSSTAVDSYESTWFYGYNQFSSPNLFGLLPPMETDAILRIAYACTHEAARALGEDDAWFRRGMNTLRGYLFHYHSHDEIEALHQSSLEVEDSQLRSYLMSLCRPILVERSSAESAIHTAIDNLILVWENTGRPYQEMSSLIRENFKKLVPLPILLLATLSKKPIVVTKDML